MSFRGLLAPTCSHTVPSKGTPSTAPFILARSFRSRDLSVESAQSSGRDTCEQEERAERAGSRKSLAPMTQSRKSLAPMTGTEQEEPSKKSLAPMTWHL